MTDNIRKVCGFGKKLKVVAPQSIVDELRKHITEALENYTDQVT